MTSDPMVPCKLMKLNLVENYAAKFNIPQCTMPKTRLQHSIKSAKLPKYSVTYSELASQLIISYPIIKAEFSHWRDVLHCK